MAWHVSEFPAGFLLGIPSSVGQMTGLEERHFIYLRENVHPQFGLEVW